MSRKSTVFVLIGIGIIIGLIPLSMPLVSKASTNGLPKATVTKAPIDPFKDIIKMYQEALQRTDLPDEMRSSIEKKLNMTAKDATLMAEGFINPPTRSTVLAPMPTIETTSYKIPDGISNTPGAPLSRAVVTVLNSWRKTTEDRYYLVYAGYLTNEKQQGTILVFHPSTHNFKQYDTPGKSGAVVVVEERGTLITLQSTEGELYYFDATAEHFVDPSGTPIPTNTPLPPTPTIIGAPIPTPISPYP